MKLPVLSVADGAEWEERLVRELDRGPHGVEIVRRCVDVVDLLAVAAAGQAQAALLAAGLRRLDTDAVDRLLACGVVPVGVVPRGDAGAGDAGAGDAATDDAHAALRAAGIDFVVAADATAEVVASVVAQAVRAASAASDDDTATARRTQRAFADPATSMALPPGAGDPVAAEDTARRGSVIAVWGPTGAPGRTTVAVGLADELARLGAGALLVDAEVYGATVAAVLGLLDESPGLAAACRRAGAQRLDAPELATLCWQLGPTLRVLTGIPLAARWPELRPSAISPVLAAARRLADFTVVDCGFCLETDEELSFDTLAPRRNGATLAVLDDADLIIAVGSADPIGMQRLVRGLADLRDAEVRATVWVVLNRVRSGVVPGDTQAELRAALQRFAGCTPAALLPDDTAALDAALSSGRVLAEAAPNSSLRRAVAELAGALTGAPATATGRRHRRR
jgi:MinD-like ATPase involved in chromosome partitioning or flagellar assembly